MKRRLYVAWLALVAVGLVSAAGWMSVQEPAAPGGAGASSNGWMVGGVLLLEPLLGEKFSPMEKIALCLNVVIALAGLAYALMLVGQVMNAPQGHEEDAGDRPGRPRRGQCLSLSPVPRGRRADPADYRPAVLRRQGVGPARGVLLRPGHRLLRRLDLLGHGRLRRHATGHGRQPPRGRRRQDQLRPGPATGLPHRHDHRHVDRRPGPVGRLDHLPDLRRAGL